MDLDALLVKRYRVPLGVRRLRFGPWRFSFGGGWYTVGPISLLHVEQLAEALRRAVGEDARAPAVFIERFLAEGAALGRAMVHLFVEETVVPHHLAAATDEEIGAVSRAFLAANNAELIFGGMARLAAAGVTIADVAVHVGWAFGMWPHDVLEQPAAAVLVIADELDFLKPRAPRSAQSRDPLLRAPEGSVH